MISARLLLQVPALLLLPLLAGCSSEKRPGETATPESLPFYEEATFTPRWFAAEDVPGEFHRISSFVLTNQVGNTVTETDLRGKIVVADFFFTTCPGICPQMTDNMMLLQNAFAQDPGVLLLSHSVTPGTDTVEVLRRYGKDKGIEAETWHLLTGQRGEIYRLAREDYFVEEDLGLDKEPDEFLHTENFVLVDPLGRLRGIYNGLRPASIDRLIEDIRGLQKTNW